MRKALFTVCVDNYCPELMEITLPNLEQFADRIKAEFIVIRDRKFPDFPPSYEKLQIHQLGLPYDWVVLVDADSMIHPDMHDPTADASPFMVRVHAGYDIRDRFALDQYFHRDGRYMGIATNFLAVSAACHDIWTPLEFGWEVAKHRTKRLHIIDEYCVSRNLARFGLKYDGMIANSETTGAYLWRHFGMAERTEEAYRELLERARSLAGEYNAKD